ncbi:TonB-dependent receptor [Ningiella sp. W23]|uniref:TonB-dependent receptor n=1 Tax=Ningiella sp. W23 TaxID=3023715 RepID=UPI00375702CD
MTHTQTLSRIFNCAFLPACIIASFQASAQELPRVTSNDSAETTEVIEVIGTRSSIKESLAIKRTADSIVEAVTIEDIGQLPDTSIAGSLERVTGVTSNEDRGRPTQLIIRGLGPDLTLTTLNGRELASQQDGREIQLGLIPSDIIQQARVIKSPTADAIEGGVAGTVDLRSARGLDFGKQIFAVRVSGVQSDMPDTELASNNGFRTNLSYIDQFSDNTVGISLGLAFNRNPVITNQYVGGGEEQPLPRFQWDGNTPRGFGDVDADGLVDFFPRVNILQGEALEANNSGGIFGLQWRPSDKTELNFDAMYTKSKTEGGASRLRVIMNNRTRFTNLVSTDADIGSAQTLSGEVVNGALVESFDATRARVRVDSFDRELESTFSAFGANLQHQLNNDWSVSADIGYSEAEFDRTNIETTMQHNEVGFSFARNGGDFPSLTNFSVDLENPTLAQNQNQGFRPELFALNNDTINDELLTTRIDFTRELSSDTFTQVSFGARYADRTKTRGRDFDGQGFNTSPFASSTDINDSLANAQTVLQNFPFDDFLSGANATSPSGFFYLDPNALLALRGEPNLGLDTRDLTINNFDVDERYSSAYGRVDFESEIGDVMVWGNAGVRVVRTETTSNVITPTFSAQTDENGVITEVTIDPIDVDSPNIVSFENSYTEVLPNLNVVFELHDDLLLRTAVAKTMSRPVFQLLGSTLELQGLTTPENPDEDIAITGTAGNPNLDAFTAWQYDASFEWYASDDIALTVGLFYKDVEGFVINDQRESTLSDQNGLPVSVIVDQPVNDDESGYISGLEIGYNHAFTGLPAPFDGLGMSLNYSLLDTDIESNFLNSYVDGNNATPNGAGCLAPDTAASGRICSEFTQDPNNFAKQTFNGVFYYNKGPANFRIAVRYKDDQTRQGENLNFPRIQQGETFIDFSASYAINKHFRLLAGVTNVTDEPARVFWQDPWGSNSEASTNRFTQFGRTYTLGVIYRM